MSSEPLLREASRSKGSNQEWVDSAQNPHIFQLNAALTMNIAVPPSAVETASAVLETARVCYGERIDRSGSR